MSDHFQLSAHFKIPCKLHFQCLVHSKIPYKLHFQLFSSFQNTLQTFPAHNLKSNLILKEKNLGMHYHKNTTPPFSLCVKSKTTDRQHLPPHPPQSLTGKCKNILCIQINEIKLVFNFHTKNLVPTSDQPSLTGCIHR